MAKRTRLSDALHHSAGQITVAPEPHDTLAVRMVQQRPSSRQGKKTVAGHFDPAVSRQLRQIALAEESSVQDLLKEALNELFVKRGKPPIA